MNFTNIYTLRDPETNKIRYIGKANNVTQRYRAHLNKARKHQTHKKNWIESLKKKKLKPIIEVIDIVPLDDWRFWETYWISQIKTWGFDLVNHTSGGDGCTFANKTSFKKGENSIPILQISDSGVVVKEFESYIIARRVFGKDMFKSIDKERLSTGGFLWLRKITYETMTEKQFNDFINCYINRKRKSNDGSFKTKSNPWNTGKSGYKLSGKKTARRVGQFDLSGEFIRTFDSCRDASNKMKCIEENIRRACVGKSKTAKGFIWKYE
jgi:hypothetical protein